MRIRDAALSSLLAEAVDIRSGKVPSVLQYQNESTVFRRNEFAASVIVEIRQQGDGEFFDVCESVRFPKRRPNDE